MISPEAKDFVSQILKPAESRITAVEAMQHPWMDTISTNDASQAVLKRTISNLTKFRADRQLQRAVLSFITNQMASNEELKEIENKFHAIDKNNDGRISKEELIEAYTQIYGQKYADEEVNQMMQEIDVDGNGFIDYSEFILAQADKKRALSEVNLKAAFDRFDGDGNGSISIDELKKVLGNQQTDEVLESIMKEVDLDGNGEIDIKEFQKMMFRKF